MVNLSNKILIIWLILNYFNKINFHFAILTKSKKCYTKDNLSTEEVFFSILEKNVVEQRPLLFKNKIFVFVYILENKAYKEQKLWKQWRTSRHASK